jgi:hypothetical protein
MSFHARYGPLSKIPMNISIGHDARLSFEFIPVGSLEVPATACCQTASLPGFSCLKPASHNSGHQNKNKHKQIQLFHLPKLQCTKTFFPAITLIVF